LALVFAPMARSHFSSPDWATLFFGGCAAEAITPYFESI
jgi:hypothetical protein